MTRPDDFSAPAVPGPGPVDRESLRPRPARRHPHRPRPRQRGSERGRDAHAGAGAGPQDGQGLRAASRPLQAALEAGADPAVVTQWINEAQADKETARKKLDTPPAATRKKETPLTADQIRQVTERLGDIAQRVHAVDAEEKGPLYEALGITISYKHARRAATVRSRPSSAYRYSECPRTELTTNDTAVVAQGRLR
ncbi:hypothetical protein GCM10010121_049250 [Streptomyces brasiliensis]|uniref:Uncharacterized protein n=1 Tax=Streptomyces brasiliensis TaxID=1954 RepID=A0A917KX12_9ACTN|nr:hypothetical protein GCM10010121_049250 [Streptomyces brasiliensis]